MFQSGMRFCVEYFEETFELALVHQKRRRASFVNGFVKHQADQAERQERMTQVVIHKRRTNIFYEPLIKKKIRSKTSCFDYQQNQILAKISHQQTYYSRQLYVYNFTIVETGHAGTLTSENVNVCKWKGNE
ncbi:hypothetical protein RRG08_007673 [Elysia crispata]|uniref:Uncharacterized protein n=1 Tax=Elysia crispata TaxID=231223 RepID=A0AAE0Y3I3_9GAST|nr:hypothetical protein RRG08_007673 [Elysia crispata]